MIEVVYQYDPDNPHQGVKPATAVEACAHLVDGNMALARLFEEDGARYVVPLAAVDYGIGDHAGETPVQLPMAAVLGCADARVPAELIFGQAANDLFVVRVAGNVPGSECIGSLDYAVEHLPSMRLIVVLGHTGCGAVTAAVDTFLRPTGYLDLSANLSLRAIVDGLMASVQMAAASLRAAYGSGVETEPGYRTALIELSVLLNAAVTAGTVCKAFAGALSDSLAVRFGVYNLHNHYVGLPGDGDWKAGLFPPPETDAELDALGRTLAETAFITARLHGAL